MCTMSLKIPPSQQHLLPLFSMFSVIAPLALTITYNVLLMCSLFLVRQLAIEFHSQEIN